MYSVCTICTDVMSPVEDVFVTLCGHLFHHHCLDEWVKRSKTCPQCRKTVTVATMVRVYPTRSSETRESETALLQSCLDDAHLQLGQQKVLVKRKEEEVQILKMKLQKLMEIDSRLKQNNKLLKETVQDLQERLKFAKDDLINRQLAVSTLTRKLKEQMSYMHNNTDSLRKYIKSLKRNLDISREQLIKKEATICSLKEQISCVPVEMPSVWPHSAETDHLRDENKALMNNVQALDGILSFVKEKLANRESNIACLKARLEKLMIAKYNSKAVRGFKRHVKKTRNTEVRGEEQTATTSDAAGLKRKKTRHEKTAKRKHASTSFPLDNTESTDSSDYETESEDSELELLDQYSHDPKRLYEAILKKRRSGSRLAAPETAEHPGGETLSLTPQDAAKCEERC